MPPSRRQKMGCAYATPYETSPKAKKPRAPPKKLTPEEKEQKQKLSVAKKALAEKKKEWEATLTPWVVDTSVRFRVGTLAMFKSDAKHAYGLTEKEMLTLPHECIPNSLKTFFACAQVGALALRKEKFFNPDFVVPPKDANKQLSPGLVASPRRLFKKEEDDNRRRKANFHETYALGCLLKEGADLQFAAKFGRTSAFAFP
ncbi:hypothetical protein BV25DRAFT_1829117 [Artomyces pyxidatus]|uniref:Uncharacterized protein n=1 Tax=Artomyces pyxidatus TaxID=48021 RepID=A0ACB8ST05_9AGAM|nr:hypothetical protein BV25DRAFT_1829117 [Artomyces pyxidatus]